MDAATVTIGGFRLNRRVGRLENDAGVVQHLRPKSYRVLEVLAERRGELVTKDELAASVWPDMAVTDESLAQCISEIRRLLGRDGAKRLRTVHRRGYILEAEPDSSSRSAIPAFARLAAATAGLAAAVVAGVIWAGYRQPESPVARLSNVPVRASDTIRSAMTTDWRDRAANDATRAALSKVLETDPRDARAWAELGLTYWLEVRHSAWGGGRRELHKALEAVERSLQLGADANACRVLAEIRLGAPFPDARSPVDALAAAQAAVGLAPADPDNLAILAEALVANGHAVEAVPVIETALAAVASPSDRYREVAGRVYLVAGTPAKAIEEFGRLHGAGTYAGARHYMGWFLAAGLAHAGRLDEAAAVLAQARSRRPEQTLQSVALALEQYRGQPFLDLVLDGLRLAGMPDAGKSGPAD